MIVWNMKDIPDNISEYGELLVESGKSNWIYSHEKYNKIFFYKKVAGKTDREKKDAIKTKEWLEFHSIYKTIKNSGLSNSMLIHKYNALVEKGEHKKIIENLKQYQTYLEVKNKKEYALMAQTYINQARYKDKWEIVEDMSKKWLNDLYLELGLSHDIIDNVQTEIQNWELKNKKEITNGIARNIIKYVQTGSLD